ncbi:MAG TPA: N-acetyltransferase [Ktedonobacteraceae bacterium]
MDIRQLSMDNIEEIMQFEEDHAPDKILYVKCSKEGLAFLFTNGHICRGYGVYDQGKLVAWGAYRTQWNEDNSREEGIYEIFSIVVHSLYRGKGLGKKIVDTVRSEIRNNQDYKEIYLTVSPLNVAALVLYVKNGFVISDYKRDVYGRGVDRVYLTTK